MTFALDAHEWVSFGDVEDQRTWLLDATFLESNWQCIFGAGCQGVLTEAAPELIQGCCSYGAHFSDEADRQRVEIAATRLTSDQWQFRAKGRKGTTKENKDGELVTRLVDDACIFLNRPDFHRGAGCALHVMAMDTGESYIPLKPDVCWQLPLRREDVTLANGEILTRIGQWNRGDWGEGGRDFHWWCTQDEGAFNAKSRVVDTMRDELIAMMGENNYNALVAILTQRRTGTALAHPVRRRSKD